jgi:hypothetical protein
VIANSGRTAPLTRDRSATALEAGMAHGTEVIAPTSHPAQRSNSSVLATDE